MSAVFLDRDGVINRKPPEGAYVTSWAEFAFAPGALEGLALLAGLGVPLVVVTNQRGVARGRLSAAGLVEIHDRMRTTVSGAGGHIDAVYHCPHEGGCACRKPGTLLFERAAGDLGIELGHSAVLGDREADMEAARRINALAVAVNAVDVERADHWTADLLEAARLLRELSRRA